MKAAAATPSDHPSGVWSVLFSALRGLGFVALALMLVAIVYAGWIALENWDSIGV